MALESATYITDLVSTNPDPADQKRYGDDHLRMIKSVLKATFPNASAPVTVTPTEMNYLSGVSSNLQTQITTGNAILQAQIDLRATIASPTFTGTPAAPTASAGTSTTQIATTQYVVTAIAAAGVVAGLSSVTPAPNLIPLADSSGQIASNWNAATALYAHATLGGF